MKNKFMKINKNSKEINTNKSDYQNNDTVNCNYDYDVESNTYNILQHDINLTTNNIMKNKFMKINKNFKEINTNESDYQNNDTVNCNYDYDAESNTYNILQYDINLTTNNIMKKSASYPNTINTKNDIELCTFNILNTQNEQLTFDKSNDVLNEQQLINSLSSINSINSVNSINSINSVNSINSINSVDFVDSMDSIDSMDSKDLLVKKSNYTKIYYGVIKIYNWCGLNKINKIEVINKLLSILLHIFIMIIFEIYFYFNFVVVIEKNEFEKKINSYLIEIEYSDVYLSHTQKTLIKFMFQKQNLINSLMNVLYNQYIQSLEEQKKLLHKLLIFACGIGGIVGCVLLILFGFALSYRKKIKWNWIWIENVLMFVFLGIFEYLFFTNVILHYNPITDAEIKYYVVSNLFNYYNSTMLN